MTRYELLLFVHVGAAIVWIGAGFLLALLETRALLASSAERVFAFAREAEWLGLRLFLPTNVLVLASAVLLVHEGRWGYDTLWVQLGIAGFLVSFLMGALFFGPGWARVGKLAASEGPDAPEVQAGIRRLLFVSWLDVGLLLGVVFVMTAKPAAGDVGALLVAAALPAGCALLASVLLRARDGRLPEAEAAVDASSSGS